MRANIAPGSVIPTAYGGVEFRSRSEARWAVFFDRIGLRWQYEPEGYALSAGRYLPDFFLPELKMFFEVKGDERSACLAHDRALELAHHTNSAVAIGFGIVGPPWWMTEQAIECRFADDGSIHAIMPDQRVRGFFRFTWCSDCHRNGLVSSVSRSCKCGARLKNLVHKDSDENHVGMAAAYAAAQSYRFWNPKQ